MELNIVKNKYNNSRTQTTTLVFLHGNSLNASLFEKQLHSDDFKGYQMIAIDLPGHGTSKKWDVYSIPKVVEVVFQHIKNYNDIVLVGHSLGGHIAMQLIPFVKENCKAVSLLSCCPLTKPLNVVEAYHMDELSSYFLQEAIPSKIIDDLANLIYAANDDTKKLITTSIKNTHGKFRSDIATSLLKEELKDELRILKNFQGHINFIVGKDDLFVKHSYLQNTVQEYLVNAELHTIANAGHSPHLSFPKQINEILVTLLK